MDERAEPSVWYVASVAVCVIVGVMFIAGAFTGVDASALPIK